MSKMILIVVGGGIGTLLRYVISGVTYRLFDYNFPWGTLVVNLVGSFFIGFMWDFFERFVIPPNLKIFVFIGLLGAFTTFSTYSYETFNMFRVGEIKLALVNIVVSNIFGLALVVFGFATSRYLLNYIR